MKQPLNPHTTVELSENGDIVLHYSRPSDRPRPALKATKRTKRTKRHTLMAWTGFAVFLVAFPVLVYLFTHIHVSFS